MKHRPVRIRFPALTINCPGCQQDMLIEGYDFEPTPSIGTYGKATDIYCDDCDAEFDVVVGGVE